MSMHIDCFDDDKDKLVLSDSDNIEAVLNDNDDIEVVLNDNDDIEVVLDDSEDIEVVLNDSDDIEVILDSSAITWSEINGDLKKNKAIVEFLNNLPMLPDIPVEGDYILKAVEGDTLWEEDNIATRDELASTKEELQANIDTKQDKGDYALKSEIPDVTPYATKTELTEGLSTKQDKGDYVTKALYDQTNESFQNALNSKQDAGDYVTNTELESKGYLTSYTETDPVYTADKPNLALKSELPDLAPYATKEELNSGLAGKQEAGDYALKSEIPTNNNQLENGAGYITADYHDSTKQDVIDDLDEIRSGAELGATALQSYTETDPIYAADKPNIATKDELTEGLDTKQDVIEDLETIREGASKGATALQTVPAEYVTETELDAKGYLTSYTETDPVYTADKPNIALKSEIPTKVSSFTNDANYQTATDVAQMIASIPQFEVKIVDELPLQGQKMILYLVPKASTSGDNIYDEYIWLESTSSFELVGTTTVDLSNYYTKEEINQSLNNKQNVIADLDIIRAGAELGATALQSIPTEYVTETELEAKGYLTEHQDISGKQDKITATNKLSADLIQDGTTNKVVTASEKTAWNNKQDAISDLAIIRSNASAGKTASDTIATYGDIVTHDASEFQAAGRYAAEVHTHTKADITDFPAIPSKTSDLINDSGFITSVPVASSTVSGTVKVGTGLTITNGVLSADAQKIDVDSALSSTSTNPVQNKVINTALVGKQDTISDLDTIREGASKGASALQEIPDEYVTETELNAKGYLTSYTETDPIYTADKPNIALKTDIPTKTSELNNDSGFITELPIATPSTLGVVKVDGTSILIQDDGTISSVQGPEGTTNYVSLSNKPQINSVELVGNKTLEELSIANIIHTHVVSDITDLQTILDTKANTADLATVATSGNYNDLTNKPTIPTVDSVLNSTSTNPVQNKVINTALVGKQDTISDLATIREGASKGATALQAVPTEYVTETELNAKGYLTEHQDISGKQDKITSTNKLSADLIADGTTNKVVTASEKTAWNNKQDAIVDLATIRSGASAGATAVQPDDLATVATSGSYTDLINKPTIPTVNNATISIQKNGVVVDSFTVNQSTAKTINITVPTTATDVNALPDSTKYGYSFDLSIDSDTYVVSLTMKDQNGTAIGATQTIDLPLESVVVNGSYDKTNKKIVLTLQSGSTVDVPVGDLIAGLQTEITTTNKLSADLIADGTTNKVVTVTEKSTWNNKQDTLTAGAGIKIENNIISSEGTKILTDDVTIVQNDNVITTIGTKTKSNTNLYSWVGTQTEYETDSNNGTITSDTQCLITDDESELVEYIPIATDSSLGLVQPDGTSITIDEQGVISSKGGTSITIRRW